MRRVASAAVLIAGLAATIWLLPFWATACLAAIAAAFAGGELAAISGRAGAAVPVAFVAVASAILALAFVATSGALVAANADRNLLGIVLCALVIAAGILTLALGAPEPATIARAAVTVLAPVYVGLPLGAIASVQATAGPSATTWLIAVIVASDTAQYYTGRAFGRRKLAPAVSPAKTVEGAIGGVVVAAIAGLALGRVWLPGLHAGIAAALALGLASFGIAGDLFESLIKRSAGVKDSSALIPGHGGVLDRIDSHLFAAPVFYVVLRYVA
jgi:phosphatidate cytidylyltransferase